MELGLEFQGHVWCKPRALLRPAWEPPGAIHLASVSSKRERLGQRFGQTYSHSRLEILNKRLTCIRPAAATGRDLTEAEDAQDNDVVEFRLSGDEMELQELNTSLFSIKTAENIIVKIGDVGRQFVMNNIAGVVGILKMGQKQPEPEVLELHTASIERKDGVTAVYQWSATELTMQHDQLARIAIDINYLVFAFAFFGWVRILEALLAVFATNPPVFQRMLQSFNALDYLTIAWLAHNLRKPIINILQVDPTDLQRVALLKTKVWEELHAFFERQWKVMATVAVARFLGVIANYIPPSQWITKPIKILWDMLMALPAVF